MSLGERLKDRLIKGKEQGGAPALLEFRIPVDISQADALRLGQRIFNLKFVGRIDPQYFIRFLRTEDPNPHRVLLSGTVVREKVDERPDEMLSKRELETRRLASDHFIRLYSSPGVKLTHNP
jgi:hypothetical protein